MDFTTAGKEKSEVDEASELCVLNKRVQHLSLLFYLNGGEKISFLSTHILFSSADSTMAAALSAQDRLFVMLIRDKTQFYK